MTKRPSINDDLYYDMVKAAADKKQNVVDWLADAIREKLERQEDNTSD